jgi:hypothetical protein
MKKSNTTGNYIIAIEGTFEEVQLENSNERLKTQSIKMVGQRIDLRAGIYHAMIKDNSFAELVCHSAEYFKTNHPNAVLSLKEAAVINEPAQKTFSKPKTTKNEKVRTSKK